MRSPKYIAWFSEVDKENLGLVGGKGANLGEMTRAGFFVPNGFIVTSYAYYDFIKENNLATKIKHLLNSIDFSKSDSLERASLDIKKEIIKSKISEKLALGVFRSYRRLSGVLSDAFIAVRSSSTTEDLPNASFAGQMDSFLNVKGDANVILKIKEVWASQFSARAIFYRHENKLDHLRVAAAVVVQKMIDSEKSGVMFTIDPVTNDKTTMIIEAIYGLGELMAQGRINPDHYKVDKINDSIIEKNIVNQKFYLKKVGHKNKTSKLPKRKSQRQKIPDDQIIELARIGKKLEKHYYFPQDIEWAIEKRKIYIMQTRPVTTVKSSKFPTSQGQQVAGKVESGRDVLVSGDPASPGIASGPAKIIKGVKEINKVNNGDVLVASQTNPDYIIAMKKAVAIVTEKGGRTSHAAIVSRELGIPAIVGAEFAAKILKTGTVITVNGTKGQVYKGGYLQHSIPDLSNILEYPKTATKVYVNLSHPELAKKMSLQDNDGIGLLRSEFMMAEIGTHPKKFIRSHKKQVFINKLSEGLQKFCEAFDPRPVIYRTSDLKTNEYRNLIGGKEFEPTESNPMLGYRGAVRYINDPEVFNLELEAIKLVRNIRGYKNLWIMIPFVRTVRELIDVKKLISNQGLYRSSTFKIWMMVEIPSNVILLEKFIYTGIDGISIGSNDLTMLLLGIDRDNNEISHLFDEQNEAVLWALEHIIKTCNKHKVTSSICGQAVSTYPTLLEKLVRWGITSVSVSPDALDNTRKHIAEFEKKIIS